MLASQVSLSSQVVDFQLREPDNWSKPSPLVDFELGGVAIGNASQGHEVYNWRGWIDGNDVKCAPETDLANFTVLFSRPNLRHMGIAFDQQMRPCVTFTDPLGSFLWWFDSIENSYVFYELPDATFPRITLDDKRDGGLATSDVVLAYVNSARQLCVRIQRERFATEHNLGSIPDGTYRLDRIGMSLVNRIQYVFTS